MNAALTLHCLPMLILGCGSAAWAGRPLATDDTVAADAGACQVEVWAERSRSDHALVVAPACGITQGLEIDADYLLPHRRNEVRGEAGLALKWAPEVWTLNTGAGELRFGAKTGGGFEQPPGNGWRNTGGGILALASLKADESWSLHANLGVARDRVSSTRAGLLNLAVVWTPPRTVCCLWKPSATTATRCLAVR